ncbi:MAG: tRNA dihydrouridine synthase DusB [Bacteroidetes bacterium]|nr:tRNA dihydrouridine synthase DusB [Bacteroidota bacterium]MCY4233714.1 tRNA dihydrouridine synthase DusB [Bacteroidota bacterium]
MRIGSIQLGDRPLLLAPMEDVSDPPFRALCKRYGADVVYTEFISSGGLVYEAEDSLMKLDIRENERPVGIQIFGGDIDQVRSATKIVDQVEPDIIDINFGCPVRKVVCKEAGAGILRNLPKMEKITRTVVESTDRPVTVKTRLGWDDSSIDIVNVSRMLEESGIQALAVHARTRKQMYTGSARWEYLKSIKQDGLKDIPLIGNGDALEPESVLQMFDETDADAVMIGRGAIGNPWIFQRTKSLIQHGINVPPPSWSERISVVAEHLTSKCDWLGERKGVKEMRRMYGGYFKGFSNASKLRTRLMKALTVDEVLEVLNATIEVEPNVIQLRPLNNLATVHYPENEFV